MRPHRRHAVSPRTLRLRCHLPAIWSEAYPRVRLVRARTRRFISTGQRVR